MYILRIGVSDVYFPLISSRYLIDSSLDYEGEESSYRWSNFLSDILEAVTAYTTIYLFYIYIKKHISELERKTLSISGNSKLIVQNTPENNNTPNIEQVEEEKYQENHLREKKLSDAYMSFA
jgi:hypothetical protein